MQKNKETQEFQNNLNNEIQKKVANYNSLKRTHKLNTMLSLLVFTWVATSHTMFSKQDLILWGIIITSIMASSSIHKKGKTLFLENNAIKEALKKSDCNVIANHKKEFITKQVNDSVKQLQTSYLISTVAQTIGIIGFCCGKLSFETGLASIALISNAVDIYALNLNKKTNCAIKAHLPNEIVVPNLEKQKTKQ